MCLPKPGPRCSAHARSALQSAVKSGNRSAILLARDEYDETHAGQQALQEKLDKKLISPSKRLELGARLNSAVIRRGVKVEMYKSTLEKSSSVKKESAFVGEKVTENTAKRKVREEVFTVDEKGTKSYTFNYKPKEEKLFHQFKDATGAKQNADGTLELLHRVNGKPAVEHADGTKEWFTYGHRNHSRGPAVVRPDGTKEWWSSDRRHRSSGPAIVHANGGKEFYLYGKKYSERAYYKELRKNSYLYPGTMVNFGQKTG